MRISDWSSDVCSSDLFHTAAVGGVAQSECSVAVVTPGVNGAVFQQGGAIVVGTGAAVYGFDHGIAYRHLHEVAAVAAIGVAPIGPGSAGPQGLVGFFEKGEREIGRAWCRERVCQYL